jgi:hypothetical protein
MVGSLSI